MLLSIFFFNDTATTEIYTLSLHDALPISWTTDDDPSTIDDDPRAKVHGPPSTVYRPSGTRPDRATPRPAPGCALRSEEHTSELQSRQYLVCRLLLEKKKTRLTRTLRPYVP